MATNGRRSLHSTSDDRHRQTHDVTASKPSVCPQLDKKIVTHLSHASRRMQKYQTHNRRTHRIGEVRNDRQTQLQDNGQSQREQAKNIFSCYTETGEKCQDGNVSKSCANTSAISGSLTDRGSEEASRSQSSWSNTKDSQTNGSVSSPIHSSATTDSTTLVTTEAMTPILNGEVHKECPPGKSIIYLYIVSGNTDMEAELTTLQEHLYPQLRAHFRQRGQELRILDLHWGFKDTVSDDHGLPQVFHRAINKAHRSKFGINFVILLGQKYGHYLLPREIPKEKYEWILKAATAYKKKHKQLLRAAITTTEHASEASKPDEAMGPVNTQSADNTAKQDSQHNSHLASTDDPAPTEALPDVVKDESEVTTGDFAGSEKKHRQSVTSRKDQKYVRMLRDAEDQLPDTKALRQWYILDENSIPAVYRLQDISTLNKDIIRNDAVKRQAAKLAFASIESRLQKLLKTFAMDMTTGQVDVDHDAFVDLQRSVFEQEISSVFEHQTAAEHSVCVVRTMDHLTESLDDLSTGDYVDLAPGTEAAVDTEKRDKMEGIKHKLLNYKDEEQLTATYHVDWAPGGIRPEANRAHLMYTDRMCKTLFDQIVNHPDLLSQSPRSNTWKEELFSEVSEHVRICQERTRGMQADQNVLNNIKSYLLSDVRQPLVLHGKCGCGKSTIMAAAAMSVHAWLNRENVKPHVLVRMIGCTTNSTNIRTLLRDISRQLCHVFGRNPMDIPMDYKGVVNDLTCRLGQASTEQPIIIILDGIDGLTDDYDGRNLVWLPAQLPAHVHVMISMTSDGQCLSAARKLLDGSSFLEMGQFPTETAVLVLRDRLSAVKRKLTDKQWEVFKGSFKKCPLPLFLQMLITEAVNWRSYMTPNTMKVGESLQQSVSLRFAGLERDHGEVLTRRTLGYISASRHGLTSNELEELLSFDDLVMEDIMATYKLPRRLLPTLLLTRLQEDLEDLILDCRTDNVKTIRWAHSVIAEAAIERYLSQKDKVLSFHKTLVEYFSLIWTGKSKPHTGSLVAASNDSDDAPGGCIGRVCNIRCLTELPYHLMKCKKISQLKLSCLCNYEWMLARMCTTSLESLLEEYGVALIAEPRDAEIKLVMNALLLSRDALVNEPRQLASQLIGRLRRIVTADNPKSPGDPKTYPSLHVLMAAAQQPSIPSLIPSMECMFEPGDIMFDVLSGHTGAVSAVTMTSDGTCALTSSADGTIKVWDVRSGKVIRSIDGVGSKVSTIRSALNNTLVVTVEGSLIKMWDINSGTCVFTIAQYIDPARISIAAEGKILAAIYDGSNMFRSWNLDGFSMLCQTHIPDKGIHKDNSILIADFARGDNVLHAFRSGNSATVRNVRNGNILKQLQCHDKTSSIMALAVTSDYFILCCRQQSVTQQEIQALEILDVVKGTYIRSIRGCANDNITELTTNAMGSHAIAASASLQTGTSDVAVFNLETEDHKHVAPHSGIGTMCVCSDFRFCVTGDAGHKYLKVWDLSPTINQQVRKPKKLYGMSEIWPMIDNPRYVVTKAANNGPISVWNVTKGKCLQSAVRIERGLTEGTDALVIRNTRLVILTDRGLSSVSDDPLPVFRTVLVYDLKLKKYIRKLTGCYIVPAPSHEFTLLDGDSLLGPSDNRSHFIIWNLVTGHPVVRIKTAFKELERAHVGRSMPVVGGPKGNRRVAAKTNGIEKRAQPKSAGTGKEDSKSAKRRLDDLSKEKDNAIDQFLVSGDEKIIVASFYAHHLCVFDMSTHTHTQTLQTDYSMMFLHTASLTFTGSHLVHANYDEVRKVSYVTLWDCFTGQIKRRLKGETDVCVLGVTDDAQRIAIGRFSNELHVWDPMKTHSLKRIRGYPGFNFQVNSKICLIENGDKAIVFAGDISVWDLTNRGVLAVFTPDSRISVTKVILNGRLILMGLYDKPELVVLKLTSRHMKQAEDTEGVELFGETTGDTSDEDENSEDNVEKDH